MTTTMCSLYRMTATYSIFFFFFFVFFFSPDSTNSKTSIFKMTYFKSNSWYFVVLAMVLLTDDTVTDLIIHAYRYTEKYRLIINVNIKQLMLVSNSYFPLQ